MKLGRWPLLIFVICTAFMLMIYSTLDGRKQYSTILEQRKPPPLNYLSSHHDNASNQSQPNDKSDYSKLYTPWWETGDCVCKTTTQCRARDTTLETAVLPKLPEHFGSCGWRAATDGHRQKVISYSLFGKNKKYWINFSKILKEAHQLYSGWKVWIYTDPRGRRDILCPLLTKYNHLRLCDVKNLPIPLCDVTNVHNMLWRAIPLGDPHVDVFVVRDSDAKLTKRERGAVREWLDSGLKFHSMRDHPKHKHALMGGMWGAQHWMEEEPAHNTTNLLLHNCTNYANQTRALIGSSTKPPSSGRLRELRDNVLKAGFNIFRKYTDQPMLERELWPEMKNFVMAHDGYHCGIYPEGCRPFPKNSERGNVGLRRG